MRLKEFFSGKSELRTENEQLKNALAAQRNRLTEEAVSSAEKLVRLNMEVNGLRKEKDALERRLAERAGVEREAAEWKEKGVTLERESERLKTAESALRKENAEYKSNFDRIVRQMEGYHSLAETNWALYEKASADTRESKQVLLRVSRNIEEACVLLRDIPAEESVAL